MPRPTRDVRHARHARRARPAQRLAGGLLMLASLFAHAAAAPCPADTEARPAAVLLTVQRSGQPTLAWTAADLANLPPTTLTQRLSVASSASAAAGTERSLRYGGVLLRDALQRAGFGGPDDRGARTMRVEAVATDGYRAVFSWGELFNHPAGEQVLVISQQDGQPLTEAAGPLALRALGDLRPGPRHVRNLCALVLR